MYCAVFVKNRMVYRAVSADYYLQKGTVKKYFKFLWGYYESPGGNSVGALFCLSFPFTGVRTEELYFTIISINNDCLFALAG